MNRIILLQEKSIIIKYDPSVKVILVDWIGYQTVESVKFGCEKMLEFLKQYECGKVLNDNTNVAGIWSGASAWVGKNWFPRMIAAGLTQFAWVYSPSAFSRLSTDESLKNLEHKAVVETFNNCEEALQWLSVPV